MINKWKLSSFDKFCLGMNNKGAWIYREAPDFGRMKSALEKLAGMYPILCGTYNEKEHSVVWDDSTNRETLFDTLDIKNYSVAQLTGNPALAWSLVKPFDLSGFKRGTAPAFSATLGYLNDGCILYVQCAHATMDGHTFYSLVRQWAGLYKGEEVNPMRVDQSVLPSEVTYSKEETLRLVRQKGWPVISFSKLVKMIIGLVRNHSIKYATVIEISQDEISRLKAESGAGTNAVLSAVALKKIAQRISGKNSFKMLFTTDLRGRIDGVDDEFFGNMSQPIVLKEEFAADSDTASLASLIGDSLERTLTCSLHTENVCLSMCSSHYGLQYAPFDASDMNCPGNGTIYINNFLKFRANEIDWGTGLPAYTFANELSDMVKFWQAVAGGPVQIIFGGYAAKLMK